MKYIIRALVTLSVLSIGSWFLNLVLDNHNPNAHPWLSILIFVVGVGTFTLGVTMAFLAIRQSLNERREREYVSDYLGRPRHIGRKG